MIHLEHPKHGVKIAYHEAEAEADKKNGWKVFDPKDKEAVLEDKPRLGRPPKVK